MSKRNNIDRYFLLVRMVCYSFMAERRVGLTQNAERVSEGIVVGAIVSYEAECPLCYTHIP